ncbi:MAG: hypothetical protein GY722_15300, partial [bacterium]|nr:hypothetical protein [bacterium]
PEYGEFGEEVIDGVRMECLASDAEHADPQLRLGTLVEVCLHKGYVASTELLTRVETESDFATDVCVRRQGVDPETAGRYLEEISFEVANTQTRENLEEVRVPKLLRSGVRRIFAVLVPEDEVLEWSVEDGGWKGWTRGEAIRDRVFIQPLEVEAILDAAAVDQLVSKAQLTKKEPHLMGVIKEREARGEARGRADGLAEGEAKGYAEAILLAFDSHNITLDAENRQEILECQDTALLRRLLTRALVATSASEVLAEFEKAD